MRADLDTFPTPGLLGYWPTDLICNRNAGTTHFRCQNNDLNEVAIWDPLQVVFDFRCLIPQWRSKEGPCWQVWHRGCDHRGSPGCRDWTQEVAQHRLCLVWPRFTNSFTNSILTNSTLSNTSLTNSSLTDNSWLPGSQFIEKGLVRLTEWSPSASSPSSWPGTTSTSTTSWVPQLTWLTSQEGQGCSLAFKGFPIHYEKAIKSVWDLLVRFPDWQVDR